MGGDECPDSAPGVSYTEQPGVESVRRVGLDSIKIQLNNFGLDEGIKSLLWSSLGRKSYISRLSPDVAEY